MVAVKDPQQGLAKSPRRVNASVCVVLLETTLSAQHLINSKTQQFLAKDRECRLIKNGGVFAELATSGVSPSWTMTKGTRRRLLRAVTCEVTSLQTAGLSPSAGPLLVASEFLEKKRPEKEKKDLAGKMRSGSFSSCRNRHRGRGQAGTPQPENQGRGRQCRTWGQRGTMSWGACGPGVTVPLSWWVPLCSLVGSLGPIQSQACQPALEFGSSQPWALERGTGRRPGRIRFGLGKRGHSQGGSDPAVRPPHEGAPHPHLQSPGHHFLDQGRISLESSLGLFPVWGGGVEREGPLAPPPPRPPGCP